jgi:hypothetical protein
VYSASLARPRLAPPEQSGFVDIQIGPAVDTFGGAGGESKARLFEVYGYAFLARKSNRRIGEAERAISFRSCAQSPMGNQGRCSSGNTCLVG